MNLELVEKIVNAVPYEGYILYPYRPSSMKNRLRWSFGVLAPKAYSEAQRGTDRWSMRTEFLVQARQHTTLNIKTHFLHLMARDVGKLDIPLSELPHRRRQARASRHHRNDHRLRRHTHRRYACGRTVASNMLLT